MRPRGVEAHARGGRIVNVSSTTAFNGSHGFLHYVASKGAVVSMTKTLAFELGPQQIRVNCVGARLHAHAKARPCSGTVRPDAHRRSVA